MLQKNTFDWMRQQLNGYMRTQVIAAAATFSLADHLQNGPLTVEETASITGLNREITFRESKREYHRPLRRLDLIYLGIVLGFFGLSWALLALCERL